MPRYKLIIEYDGTGLAGWQRQTDRESIQGVLEKAVAKLTGTSSDVTGAGRTDAGVHATGQVAHVDIFKEMNPYNIMHGINYHLEPLTARVIVVNVEPVSDDFHARFSATGRSYRYRIVNRQSRLTLDVHRAWHIPERLDVDAMISAAKLLLGHHDFSSFRSSICQSKTCMKTLDRFEVVDEGAAISVFAEARSFLHHQVRNMVGTLRLIGNGKWRPSQLKDALEARDRTKAGETAPAQGLCLIGVTYEGI